MILFLLLFLTFSSSRCVVAAPLVCTVCSAGIVTGLGIAKMLGIHDYIIALWFGATMFAIGCWFLYYLEKKDINNRLIKIVTFLSSYILVTPFYTKISFLSGFTFYVALGSVIVFAAEEYYIYAKNKNKKPHFPFEKVVLPTSSLFLISLIIHFFK
jgi:hypothetical protein